MNRKEVVGQVCLFYSLCLIMMDSLSASEQVNDVVLQEVQEEMDGSEVAGQAHNSVILLGRAP